MRSTCTGIVCTTKTEERTMDFSKVTTELLDLVRTWEPELAGLPGEVISERRNSQDRTIRQILGHMVDSASNNTHRIVHLQYRESPLVFPNYATGGNNDRWIAIQNYQEEDWGNLVQLWKYIHLHMVHVIGNVNPEKLDHEWISGSEYGNVSLKEMIVDFLRHFKLHLSEIRALIDR
jgi:hypothetical protein